MENNQFQNNQYNYNQPQQYTQPAGQYVQPPVYAPPKAKKSISLDFLNGPDKNKFIFAGVSRIVISVVLGILSVIYNFIIQNVYFGSGGYSAPASIYNVITSVVTLAIACVFGYMAYKEIIATIKFAGVVTLSTFVGSTVSGVLGAVVYFILEIAGAYGAIVSVVTFFIGILATVISAVAAVALLAVVEKKIDLSQFMQNKKQPAMNNPAGYGAYNAASNPAYPQQPGYPVNNTPGNFVQQNGSTQEPEWITNDLNN